MSSCSVQPSKRPSGRGHLLDIWKVDRMAISTQCILLAENVIYLKKDIKINYIPTTLSLQHSWPSMQDSLKNEGISIWFVLSGSNSAFPLCPKYYKIYLSYPNEQKKSWILNFLDFIGSVIFFVLFCFKIYLLAYLIMLQTLWIKLSSELEYSFEFSWV